MEAYVRFYGNLSDGQCTETWETYEKYKNYVTAPQRLLLFVVVTFIEIAMWPFLSLTAPCHLCTFSIASYIACTVWSEDNQRHKFQLILEGRKILTGKYCPDDRRVQ
jgi:hypothetical protein